ncbi:hypothetical protein BB561_006391 [Smittium simulii]|uniref:DSBA-like thioredoxin domain-containing protein n=1 Tax=Smittium simulii TaxID=133385 RepID=A0A2T9Y4Q9_9FUNG|nr:hypothetical protein BB561_006391 [Smittium simulii]
MSSPAVKVYFDFNSPFSVVSIMRLYQISKNVKPSEEYEFFTANITHPVLKKVTYDLKPISFGIVLKRMGAPIPAIVPGSKRAEYMWYDVSRTLKSMGFDAINPKKLANWPQRTKRVNNVIYLLQYPKLLAQAAEEVLPAQTAAQLATLLSPASSQECFNLAIEFAYQTCFAMYRENRIIDSEEALTVILSRTFAALSFHEIPVLTGALARISKMSQKTIRFESDSTNSAFESNVFGVPSFYTETAPNLFWGNERLIDAAIHAYSGSSNPEAKL